MSSLDRSASESLDATDPLAPWRDEFVIADPGLVYLDGNSLGMTPRRTLEALHAVTEQWSGDLIASWWEHGWLDLPTVVGDELAPIIGARPGEVAVHDSTTIGLFQLVDAAVRLQRRDDGDREITIAVEDTEFPTDRYVVAGIANRLRGVSIRHGLDDLAGVDVVVRSLVDYRTAAISSLAAETGRAAEAGAITVWDLSHAAGVVAMDVEAAGVLLAAGCTYKFLNGGPGSPAFTYVRTEIQDEIVQPIWGWFGQRDQFAMDRPFDPRSGAARMLNGTPNILGLTAARAGIAVTAGAGIAAIATKAARLAHHAIDLTEALGLECTTARPPASSGGHVSIVHPDAVRLQAELAAQRIVVDKRDPDVLRFGLSPLTTRYTDVFDALTTLRDLT